MEKRKLRSFEFLSEFLWLLKMHSESLAWQWYHNVYCNWCSGDSDRIRVESIQITLREILLCPPLTHPHKDHFTDISCTRKLEGFKNNRRETHLESGTVVSFYFYFIYLFLAVFGLRCCAQAFSSCGERGLLFVVAVHGLLIAVASLVAEHGL